MTSNFETASTVEPEKLMKAHRTVFSLFTEMKKQADEFNAALQAIGQLNDVMSRGTHRFTARTSFLEQPSVYKYNGQTGECLKDRTLVTGGLSMLFIGDKLIPQGAQLVLVDTTLGYGINVGVGFEVRIAEEAEKLAASAERQQLIELMTAEPNFEQESVEFSFG